MEKGKMKNIEVIIHFKGEKEHEQMHKDLWKNEECGSG